MLNFLKKCYRWVKANPVFAFSITIGIVLLLYKSSTSVQRAVNGMLDASIKAFILPLAIPTYVTSKFGRRLDPVTKAVVSDHNGIDLHAPMGTPVYAPEDGKADVSVSTAGGNQLIITHVNGFKTGYAHLSKTNVKDGDEVKKGDLVAYTGNSGAHTTAAHLHFTVTDPKGKKIDPLTIFPFSTKKA